MWHLFFLAYPMWRIIPVAKSLPRAAWCSSARLKQQVQAAFLGQAFDIRITESRDSTCARWAGSIYSWLVVSTPLKNISQLGWLFPIYGKIKNVPNHQPDSYTAIQVSIIIYLKPNLFVVMYCGVRRLKLLASGVGHQSTTEFSMDRAAKVPGPSARFGGWLSHNERSLVLRWKRMVHYRVEIW